MICRLDFLLPNKSDKAKIEVDRIELEKRDSLEKFKIPYEGEFDNNSNYYLNGK